MDSLIDQHLARLKKDAEDREAAREAARRVANTYFETPGIFTVTRERVHELAPQTNDFESAKAALLHFDFEQATTASFLELIFTSALTLGVSDIHYEPEAAAVRIRFRLDGLLYDAGQVPLSFYHLVVSRLKIIAGMQLNTAKPHDGRFTIALPHTEVAVRASSTPSQYGETVVLRVLDPHRIALSLTNLGLRTDDLVIIREELTKPNGMILNTGPTGSGKTTTLYAFLTERARPEIKIITIEDPIEYQLSGIEQTEVHPDLGYSFSNGLRSLVRQDPDILFIGEIRDQETADIAIQAALTGHLVFSTIHANEAAGAIPRLFDMNIKETSIGPALNIIMAQRLVRRLCDQCKKPKVVSAEEQERYKAFVGALPQRVNRNILTTSGFYEPVGCSSCRTFGYRGRVGIFELLRVDEEMEAVIEKRASETEIRHFAIARGMVTMQQDGIIKALCGITTLEEVAAATGQLPFSSF